MHEDKGVERKEGCLAKRLWEGGTPYIQSGGFLTLLGGMMTIGWMIFCFGVGQTPAFADMKTKFDQLHDSIIQIQQEVHDIHGWMQEGRP